MTAQVICIDAQMQSAVRQRNIIITPMGS